MAPKRKMGTRMDAALDSMLPYGFPKKLVRQTVNHLLKVYGGSDGWVFIEDSAYSLLIETLLEKQQEEEEGEEGTTAEAGHNVDMEDNPADGHSEAPPTGSSNGTLIPCSNLETFVDSSLSNQAIETVSATSETCIQLPIKPLDTLSPASETSKQSPIKAVNPASATCGTDCKPNETFAMDEIHGTPLACSSLQTKLPQPAERLCHQRRRPCFGWISDDEEDEEPIELPPAPLCLKSKLKY
ncbi:PREDICTED: uncharacterized protein LOC109335744 [Lupinus angustifolius]|uniref:uncharacterized protein LOC109335744 n=1 Tax=Lupinus angustifolius TaxID=3871 RepID=UPI00092FB565|nr:PREDICTED: uncharacterized protein LOC109335744 [Lupinus angustifolius]